MPGKKKSLFKEGDFVKISESGMGKIYAELIPLFDGILEVVNEPMRGLRVYDKTRTYWIDCNSFDAVQYLESAEDLEFEDVDTQIV